MFPSMLMKDAERLLAELRLLGAKLAIAESFTGGFVSALFTEIPGSSDVFDCGFVACSDAAKITMLGLSKEVLEKEGAASREVAVAMAEGALARAALATVTIAVTDVAYKTTGNAAQTDGTIYLAAVYSNTPTVDQEVRLVARDPTTMRLIATDAAIALIRQAIVIRY